MIIPPSAFLADVYRHLPFLVIHVTTDGVILHSNPEVSRVTGYQESELLGQNLWALLFPGRLFAQVPRFISLANPAAFLKDIPMTIRTRSGEERVIAWTRYIHNAEGTENAGALRSFICVGVDLTDRLLDADRSQAPDIAARGHDDSSAFVAFGPHVGNAGAIDSEIVTPIAITPKPVGGAAGAAGPCPIEQVRDGLAQVETHINCVRGAFAEGEIHTITALATILADTRARLITQQQGRRTLELLAREDDSQLRACAQTLGLIRSRVEELLALYHPEFK